MADVIRRNPAGKRSKRRNAAKKKLSAKQIKYFGTPAQKAALKRKRRGAAKRVAAPKRNSAPAASSKPKRRRRSSKPLPNGFERARGFKVIRDAAGKPKAVKIYK